MTRRNAEHHCDGVWIDLDVVLGAAGEGQLDEAARAAASFGATGLIGDAASLERTRIPESLGTLVRGVPEEHAPWDLALVVDPTLLDEASAWCSRTAGQLVLSEEIVGALGHEGLDRLGGADTVAGIWCEDADGEALELARSSDDLTGFHGGLEFATAYRAGAGALLGPIPMLHPALAAALHELRRDHVERAHDAERRLAKWIETDLLPACRALGLERGEMGRAAIEIGGWLRPRADHLGGRRFELRRQLVDLATALDLASVAEVLSSRA